LEYQFEKFCTSCGHELEQGRLPAAIEKERPLDQCNACGRVFRADERFCGGCGLPYGKATAGVFRFYVEEDSVDEDTAL
jgi:rRNA maturation endonuclease Nob1